MVIVPNFCFEEFRFDLHADFIVLVDFLHALGSIEGRFFLAPNAFEQTPGLFCCNYCFANPSWDVLHLGMFGMWWCMFVDEVGQGSVILFIESVGFLGWIIKLFRSEEICFHFLFINFMVFTKGNSSISLGYGV